MLKKIVGTIWRKMPRVGRRLLVRATQDVFTMSVAAIITNEKSEVLLLDHVLRIASGWGIPGGFVSRGEQPEQALRRELREETGLELENLKMIRVRTIERHVEILYRANASGKASVKSREIKSAAWFGVNKMPSKMNRAQRDSIAKILSE